MTNLAICHNMDLFIVGGFNVCKFVVKNLAQKIFVLNFATSELFQTEIRPPFFS